MSWGEQQWTVDQIVTQTDENAMKWKNRIDRMRYKEVSMTYPVRLAEKGVIPNNSSAYLPLGTTDGPFLVLSKKTSDLYKTFIKSISITLSIVWDGVNNGGAIFNSPYVEIFINDKKVKLFHTDVNWSTGMGQNLNKTISVDLDQPAIMDGSLSYDDGIIDFGGSTTGTTTINDFLVCNRGSDIKIYFYFVVTRLTWSSLSGSANVLHNVSLNSTTTLVTYEPIGGGGRKFLIFLNLGGLASKKERSEAT